MTTITEPVTRRIVIGSVCGALFVSLFFGLLSTGTPIGLTRAVRAQEEIPSPLSSRSTTGFKCRNETLEGRYATRGDGVIPSGPPPAPMVPFATVSLMTLDGSGNLSNAVTTSANGVIASNVNSGTYTINEDCTGEMSINIPVPPFHLTFDLVIVDKGKEFYSIATTPSVVTVGAKRVQ